MIVATHLLFGVQRMNVQAIFCKDGEPPLLKVLDNLDGITPEKSWRTGKFCGAKDIQISKL